MSAEASPGPVSTRWDTEYRAGRYSADPPLSFVQTILSTLRGHGSVSAGRGLYVGCGNGRNYLPLVDVGLNLYGLDLSREALGQLARQRPAHAARLICADFHDFQSTAAFDYLVAIQVFQHGGEARVSAYWDRVATLVRPGGLFFLRVNSVAMEVYHGHTSGAPGAGEARLRPRDGAAGGHHASSASQDGKLDAVGSRLAEADCGPLTATRPAASAPSTAALARTPPTRRAR